MIEIIILIALGATALAGLWDLRTTEVPDQIPAIMIIAGLAYWFISATLTGDFQPLIFSSAIGTFLLAVGLLLYKKGQWGGADAWILASVGYMIPLYSGSLFIIPYIMNFFIISAAYMIVYSLLLGIRNPYVFRLFAKDIRDNKKIFLLPVSFLAAVMAFSYYVLTQGYLVNISVPLEIFVLIFLLTLFWRYGKIIEDKVFKKKIPTSKLKVGDVLEEMNWVGLTKKQVAQIKKRKRFVTIKEGVRFVPVFFLSLVATLLFGNLLFAFVAL